MNVPKLRFKEFNDEWIERKLSELYTFKNGINGDRTLYGKGIKFISVGDILNNAYITYEKIKGLINIDEKSLYENSVEFGDVLFQRSSETRKEIGMSNVYLDDKISTFGGFVIRGKKNKDNNNNPMFINYLLRTQNVRKDIVFRGAGAQHYNIGQEDLKKVSIMIPSIKEQIKVSNFLSLLDKKIELQTKKIEDLKLFKKGLLNLCIKNIETMKVPLKRIIKECSEKSISNDQYDILSSTANGLYLQKEYFNKQAASENNIGYKIIKKGQLVLSPQNLWMGNININRDFEYGIVSPSYKVFDINQNIVNVNYFDYWIKSPRALYEYMISSEQGASIVRRNLNMDLFFEIMIEIPSKKEQDLLGNQIKNINKKIELETMVLSKLNELKKGLMQNVFV